ncbi:MAG: dTDP-4-dehydrorhamnose 3,5-epimerase family protein [Bacteroidota bacterium]
MKIEETTIEGLKLIRLNRFEDIRGSFVKPFNAEFFESNSLETNLRECYFSLSHSNVIRGMHFQLPPFEHTKLVFVNNGSILDVVLDIRKDSKTFGKYFSVQITEDDPILVYIPIGCAHGFLSLENSTIVSYMQTTVYKKDCDVGIHYDSFGMDWKVRNPIISDRDKSFVNFTDFISPF